MTIKVSMLSSKNSGLLITSTIPSTIFTELLLLYFVKLIWKYTKNEIGETARLQSTYCHCITGTKFIKTNFSLDFYWRIFYFWWNLGFKTKYHEQSNLRAATITSNRLVEELKKYPPISPAVLWFANSSERKTR